MDPSLATLPPTAPGGGEFGVPSVTRQDTIDDSHLRAPQRLKLKIQPPPPPYPYADSFFDIEVSFMLSLRILNTSPRSLLLLTHVC
ncbi:unnamed protein product [Choristocarpus tenellus]